MRATVSLYATDMVSVRVNESNPRERFIILDLGGLDVYLTGYNAECAEQARLLADNLHAAARALEVPAAEPVVVRGE